MEHSGGQLDARTDGLADWRLTGYSLAGLILETTAEALAGTNGEPGGEAWVQRKQEWQAQEEQDKEESENNTTCENCLFLVDHTLINKMRVVHFSVSARYSKEVYSPNVSYLYKSIYSMLGLVQSKKSKSLR